MRIREALAIGAREIVAFVGAGGKTTAMFRLARELRADGAGAVVTTTTRILVPPERSETAVLVEEDARRLLDAVAEALRRGRTPVAGRATTPDGKLLGVAPELVAELAGLPGVTHVLVEADGAARKPLTAPREGEPVIPTATTIVVPVVGIDALGARLSDVAHRPERVMALTGLGPNDRLDAAAIARVMLDPAGNVKGAPSAARIVPLVNKVDGPSLIGPARQLASALRRTGAERVVIAALEAGTPIVEVSAAAG